MKRFKQRVCLTLSLLMLALTSGTALAHKASDSFIYLNQDRGEIRMTWRSEILQWLCRWIGTGIASSVVRSSVLAGTRLPDG